MVDSGPSFFARARRLVELLLMAACWIWGWVAFVKLWIDEPRPVGWQLQAAVYALGVAATSAWGWATYSTQSLPLAKISVLELETLYFTWHGFWEYIVTGTEHHIDGLRLRTSLLKGLPMAITGLVISGWGLSAGALCQVVIPQAQGRLHRECGRRDRQFDPEDLERVEGMTAERMEMLRNHSEHDWDLAYPVEFTRTKMVPRKDGGGWLSQWWQAEEEEAVWRTVNVTSRFQRSEECRDFVRAASDLWQAAGCRAEHVLVEKVDEHTFNEKGGFFAPSSLTIWQPHGLKSKFLNRVMPMYKRSIDEGFGKGNEVFGVHYGVIAKGYDKVSFLTAATNMLKSPRMHVPVVQLTYETTWKQNGAFAIFQATNAFFALGKRGLAGRDAPGGAQALMFLHVVTEGLFTSTALVNIFVAFPAAKGFQEAVQNSMKQVYELARRSTHWNSALGRFQTVLTGNKKEDDEQDSETGNSESRKAAANRNSLMSLGAKMMRDMAPKMLPSWSSFVMATHVLGWVAGAVGISAVVCFFCGGAPSTMGMFMVLIGFMGSPCVRMPGAPLSRNAMRCQLTVKTAGVSILWLYPLLSGYEEGLAMAFAFLLERDFSKGVCVRAVLCWAAASLITGLLALHWLPEAKECGGQGGAGASGWPDGEQAASQLPIWHGTSRGQLPEDALALPQPRAPRAGFRGSPGPAPPHSATGYGAVAALGPGPAPARAFPRSAGALGTHGAMV